MNRQMRAFIITFFVGLLAHGFGYAQSAFQTVEPTLESPYNTMLVHLHYLQSDSYEPEIAAQTIYGVEDSARASRLAIQLKQVLDGQGLYVRLNRIPQDGNYLDSVLNKNYFTPFPEEMPEIYLEKVGSQWFYSRETVQLIPELHKRVYPFGIDALVNWLPRGAQQRFLRLFYWQWLGLLIVILIATFLIFLLARVFNPIVTRITKSKIYPSLIPKILIRRLARYISIWVVLRILSFLLPLLQLPVEINNLLLSGIKLIGILLMLLIGLSIVEMLMKYVAKITKRTESKMDEQLVPIVKRTLQAIIIGIAVVSALRLLNVNVTALIAGISIGGLAIALAAQDTVKNLFGSFTILFDKPFQIGDWVNFGGVDGTVEEVGFRSTRVRTFANSLVYVPNGKLADMIINNYGLRVYRRFSTKISITYDTPPVLIEKFIEGLKGIVANHPSTRKDYFEISLNEMSATSLDILFYIFFTVPSWTEELKAKHEILLATLELADKLGVRFAFPTTTIHVEEFPGAGKTANPGLEQTGKADSTLEEFLKNYTKRVNPGS